MTGSLRGFPGRPALRPVWIAGYGPKVLDLAGRIADGVILQFADPDLIEWCLSFVKKGAEAAGRDPRKIEVMSAAAVWVSDDLPAARKQVRWFPALVSNHVVDLISRYKPEELPAGLTSYVQQSREIRLSAALRSGERQLEICFRRSCRSLLPCGVCRGAPRETAQTGQRGGHAVQYLLDVGRRRENAGRPTRKRYSPPFRGRYF